ncbi:P-loop containing nucleoside triphosphate hydrolase protein [Roridomyces roridus]|uniref:P-loop containing nucleoside triphosphate hydrolase protein n=1 Tax=Roridomyces roridus TaxID=1738132 RepID=A0AAD7BPN5_9AGAR|nr:P-loop containing nucleoside triphosphate hydrolase protein [Roridomyces roridus]
MSASASKTTASSTRRTTSHVRRVSSSTDSIAIALLAARTIEAAAECAPFPFIKGAFGAVVVLLELVEKARQNRADLEDLCHDSVDIIKIVRDQISSHGDTAAFRFKDLCEELDKSLCEIVDAVRLAQSVPKGFCARLRELFHVHNKAEEIAAYQNKLRSLRSNFVLLAAVDTNFQVHKMTALVASAIVPQAATCINNCSPPSRIFRGRHTLLANIHSHFSESSTDQKIFLLHGLGGAGKTQIALKFISEASQFLSDVFLVDASTTDTIKTGLENIATAKASGTTAQDALKLLGTKPGSWLLFFDNADDPTINLNAFFPRCNHGNILITSRNPGLSAYASSSCLVSDLEETDAVDLLLVSAGQETTHGNKDLALDIVRALWLLPLAIIQAGAFIARTGSLKSYLALYTTNRSRLLSEKPSQSHDDYAWTVYTTWEISFKQLSSRARNLLQLCSFLYHQGISEQIFRGACAYNWPSTGPSREELHKAVDFLSQFSGPSELWDSLAFTDATTELRAYSLINFSTETGLFSIHPLVHSWLRGTVLDRTEQHSCMVTILGMSIAGLTDAEKESANLRLLPHVDALLETDHGPPDFHLEFARVYYHTGRPRKEEALYAAVLEKRTILLGESHSDTLEIMGNLSWTYHKLGQYAKAEQLQTVLLDTRSESLGVEHPDTLRTMANLASTYHHLGWLSKAEELGARVLEQQKKICGEDHLGSGKAAWDVDTLEAMANMTLIHLALGELEEARRCAVVTAEKNSAILGEDHPKTLRAMGNLAEVYVALGKVESVESGK